MWILYTVGYVPFLLFGAVHKHVQLIVLRQGGRHQHRGPIYTLEGEGEREGATIAAATDEVLAAVRL
jgi:hypothetical protein